MNVLIIDDEMLNCMVAERHLKQYFPSFNVRVCQKPKEVMKILEEDMVDIILLDIMMPEMSGIEVLQEIRQHLKHRTIQIIMFSALTDMSSFETCFQLGANDYLRKPIEMIEFQARIKAAADTRKNTLMLNELYEKMKSQNEMLKSVNAKLKDTQFHLIQSEKLAAIGELAAGVAHEINNPIGYVGSNLETMSNYLSKMQDFIKFSFEISEKLKDSCDITENEQLFCSFKERYKKNKLDFIMEDVVGIISDSLDGIKRVAEIVKSLRNFARTGVEDEKGYYSIGEIVQQVLLMAKNEAKYTVKIENDTNNVPEVYCNRGQVGQVFLNIIVNAVQAIKEQKKPDFGNICIRAYKEGEYICTSIKDDGPGIPEEYLTKIFNPFFTTKEVGQGTGLGLSISYEIIVKKHNGMLEVNSVLGTGTEFIIKLPLIINMNEGASE